MKRKFGLTAALLTATLALAQNAQASDSLLGALLGAGAGVVVGQAVGGRDGAIVGGGIGAIAGAAIASERHRTREVYAPARRSVYYEEPVVVERPRIRHIEHERGWNDHRWEDRRWSDRGWDDRRWRNWREHRGERCWRED